MINLKIKTNGTVRNLTLPYPGQSINFQQSMKQVRYLQQSDSVFSFLVS